MRVTKCKYFLEEPLGSFLVCKKSHVKFEEKWYILLISKVYFTYSFIFSMFDFDLI